MAMSNQVQLLPNISTEVDESELRIFFANECHEAQEYLLNKLKKEVKDGKCILNIIIQGNKKTEIEKNLAEQELNNLIIALNSIKSGNLKFRTELLLRNEKYEEISERLEAGEKKYKELWLESNIRYEKRPLVKQCREGNKIIELTINNISNLHDKRVALVNQMELKKRAAQELDQKRASDVAKYLLIDRPKFMKMIQERIQLKNQIKDLSTNLQGPSGSRCSKVTIIELEENSPAERAMPEKKKFYDEFDTFLMPKLQSMDVDLDILGDKLDQIKKFERIETPTVENKLNPFGYKIDVTHSPTIFNNKLELSWERNKKYSDRKLINILGDITLGRSQTLNIISNIDPNNLQSVNTIGSQQTELVKICLLTEDKVNQPLKEIVEQIENNEEEHVVQSPAQVLDRKKKKVSFNVSKLTEVENYFNITEDERNETLKRQNISSDNIDNENLRDNVLMAHKLDATPEFVYAKHITNKITEDKTITSKFFGTNKVPEANVACGQAMQQNTKIQEIQENFIKPFDMDIYNKTFDKINSKISDDVQKPKYQLSGLLSEHGTSQIPIPDSLNAALDASGFEADDSYPQYLDSSVLLSPKADAMDGANTTAMAQVHSFMSGLRKPGGSLFEQLTNDNKSSSSNTNTEGNFNFNFGGAEKKKGGFFNMFFNN